MARNIDNALSTLVATPIVERHRSFLDRQGELSNVIAAFSTALVSVGASEEVFHRLMEGARTPSARVFSELFLKAPQGGVKDTWRDEPFSTRWFEGKEKVEFLFEAFTVILAHQCTSQRVSESLTPNPPVSKESDHPPRRPSSHLN